MPRSNRCSKPLEMTRRQGALIVLVALLLPVIFIFVGFSVDMANMQRVRTEIRAVADLSAKAAAGELSRTQNINKAKLAAKAVASANHVAGQPLTLTDQDIVFGHSDRQSNGSWDFQPGVNPFNAIRVYARRTTGSTDGPVPLFFGQLYGKENFEQEFAATSSFLDVDICLVLDRSSSMKLSSTDWSGLMSTSDPRFCQVPWADSRWVALENSINLFVNHLQTTLAIEHVAVITFASDYTSSCGETNIEATVDQDLNADLNLVTTAMAARTSTVWNGATNIDAGITSARTVLTGPTSRDFATKVMVVLTDGVYTGPDPLTEATLAGEDGIFIHAITFGDGANQSDMQDIAEAGNGDHYHAPDAASLDSVFQQIAGAIAILTE